MPPGKNWLSLVATMRRIKGSANGGWRWEEFTRSSPTARFTKVGFPQSGCAACHSQAKKNDYVFTRRLSRRSSAGSSPSESRSSS